MRVVMTNDSSSWKLKTLVQRHLIKEGYEILDLGTNSEKEKLPYTKAGHLAAEAIRKGDADLGVIFCGSGAGVCIVANKHEGVSAVVCESEETARGCRISNNADLLCMGGNIVAEEKAKKMADIFLSTSFMQDIPEERQKVVSDYLVDIRKMEGEVFI